MSACCHIRRLETACPAPPPVQGGTVTLPPPTVDAGLWFECAYDSCHDGVGFVRLYNSTGALLYSGCPPGRPRAYVNFNASLLDYGSRVHVDYVHNSSTLLDGLTSPCAGGHRCDRARFRVGLGASLIGIADMDNRSGADNFDRYNRFTIPNSIIDTYLAAINPGTGPAPAIPNGLRATYINQQKIVLIWNDLAATETGYEIQRKTPSTEWATLATAPANSSIYEDAVPPSGAFGFEATYSYRVRATGGSTASPWTDVAEVTTPPPPDPSRRQVCYIEVDTCNLWTEIIPNAKAAVNYIPVGFKIATLPPGKTIRIALINYASRGSATTSRGALLEVRSLSGSILATLPLNLASNGSPLSPFPFDGRSIDGNPFVIQNSWGAPVDILAAGGVPGYPGIYFDDSAAYQIV